MGLVTFSDDAGNSRFASPQPLRTIERLSISIAQAFGQFGDFSAAEKEQDNR